MRQGDIGGPQFGSIGQQSDGTESKLQRAECPEELLPEGILEATPISFGGYSVYLGFDESQSTYYAAYREEDQSEAWTVLQATGIDEAGFIEALESYFA